MAVLKRKLSIIDLCDSSPESSPKRTRTPLPPLNDASNTPVPIEDEDEEDFQVILRQIKEQEESEALAKRMQEEFASVASTSASHRNSDTDITNHEDDEALARRLAAEWAEEDQPVQDRPLQREAPDDASPPQLLSASLPSQTGVLEHSNNIAPDEQLVEYKDLFTGQRACTKCGKQVPSPRGFVVFSSTTVPPSRLLMLLHAPCTSCKTNHCRGCFKPVSCSFDCKGPCADSSITKPSTNSCPVLSCCAESRSIAIFETLGAFDRLILGERATSESRALENMAKNKGKSAASVGPGGTGYGADSFYESIRFLQGGTNQTSETPNRADQLAAHWEELISRALQTLTYFLPAPYSDSAESYDLLPHPSIGLLISASQLPEVLGSLLRNDSVTDWTDRLATYQATLALLRRMADCELTLRTLIEPRWEIKKSCGLEQWMWGEGDITWERKEDGTIIHSVPLYRHFQKLTKQSEAFLSGALQMMNAESGHDDEVEETIVSVTSLCGDIIAARDDIQRTMSALGSTCNVTSNYSPDVAPAPEVKVPVVIRGRRKGKGRGKTKSQHTTHAQAMKQQAMKLDQAYIRACERLALKYVMLGEESDGQGWQYRTFNFESGLRTTANAARNPKDRMHLVKELAVMATSLPPGVWVRVDEVRNDVVKVLIAGPEGTPYAGGLFEFDCWMPLEYPRVPPHMHLRTTGGGTVRFNPNLYSNGKVCLSLLGTWPGRPEEQWSPKSTLLQVLVSIQSMILIDLPYFNEPGRGQADPQNRGSQAYNREISFYTVRWAIVDWLKDEHRYGIWADVIATHFTVRSAQIREQIIQWAAKERRIQSAPRTHNDDGAIYGLEIDLLEEFDKGIERIKAWNLVNEDS